MDAESRVMLLAVAAEVLEKQAFLFAEEGTREETDPPAGASLRATMAFSGPVRGIMELAAPLDLCTELAGNLLGLDPGDPAALANAGDALKELLNVACGQYLTAVYGSGPVFRLSIPSVVEIGDADWADLLDSETTLLLDVDGTPALVRCTAEAQV